MGRKPLGKLAVTRRISPVYVAILEQMEAAGFDLEAVLASANLLLRRVATTSSYDPFDWQDESQRGFWRDMNTLMAKELYGDTWASTYKERPEDFQPPDAAEKERIQRNLDKHRAYVTYTQARLRDQEDVASREPGGGRGAVEPG